MKRYSLLRKIAIAGSIFVAVAAIAANIDWQVAMVKTGVKLLGSPSSADQVMAHQSSDNSHDYLFRTVTEGLELPWSVVLLDDKRALITERAGNLLLVSLKDGQKQSIEGMPKVHYKGQGGLFDVAVHPNFADNQWAYFSYSVALANKQSTTRLARAKLDLANRRLSDWQVLYDAYPALNSNKHYGGRLLFHDQHLYLTIGERGHREYAQSIDNDLGKVLRLHPDGSTPVNNPFVNQTSARPAIYSYGHRNPQGLTRRPSDNSLWISEHGPQGGDEINRLQPGANYGWPAITYGEEYGGGIIGSTHQQGMKQPLHYYKPSIGTGNLAFYDGDSFPAWQGQLFVTGLRSFDLSRLATEIRDGRLSVVDDHRMLGELRLRLRDIKIDELGAIYLLSENGALSLLTSATDTGNSPTP